MIGPATSATSIALDQNFPLPILQCVEPYLPDIQFAHIEKIDRRLSRLDDWQVIVALWHRGFSALASNDYHMLDQYKVVTAALRTKLNLILIEGLGDDAIRATGSLLLDLSYIATHIDTHRCRIFRIKRNNPAGETGADYLNQRATRRRVSLKELVKQEQITADDLRDPLATDEPAK